MKFIHLGTTKWVRLDLISGILYDKDDEGPSVYTTGDNTPYIAINYATDNLSLEGRQEAIRELISEIDRIEKDE